MNLNEYEMIEVLKKLKNEYGVVEIKAEYENEGSRQDELMRLKDIAGKLDLPIIMKIGGVEAITDIYNAITNLKNNKQINKRYIFDLDDALENMKFLDNISKSRSKKIWHTIK